MTLIPTQTYEIAEAEMMVEEIRATSLEPRARIHAKPIGQIGKTSINGAD